MVDDESLFSFERRVYMTSMLKTARRWLSSRGTRCHWRMETLAQVRTLFCNPRCHFNSESKKWKIVASHKQVRSSVGLFDVGHMVQSKYVACYPPLLQASSVSFKFEFGFLSFILHPSLRMTYLLISTHYAVYYSSFPSGTT